MPHQTGPRTALQMIEQIIKQTGVDGRGQTIDHVSAGDPLTAVTGIAVIAMATLNCLQGAAAAGHNLVVSYDPGFWSTSDNLDGVEGNALFQEKRDFIARHNMVVFNLHDHWRDRVPDGLNEGMARTLGWTMPPSGQPFDVSEVTLLDLARHLQRMLDGHTMRVVGDPGLVVHKVAMALGNAAQMPTIALLNGPADVVLAGYCREWEAVEYVQDMVASGSKKAMILLGEVLSVEPGMRFCADWLKSFITDVPVGFVTVGEGYWSPTDRE